VVSALADQLAVASAERDEYLGALQLMKADFDNYRKRVARQQEEQAARAAADLVSKLLPVIDNLDLAWAHLGGRSSGEMSEEARALGQARQQLLDVLAREGLERVDAVDVPFDPTVHDAVAHVPAEPGPDAPGAAEAPRPSADSGNGNGTGTASDTGNGTHGSADQPSHAAPGSPERASDVVSVDSVMRAGYRWRGQVLRPAMVRVRG
jgi:molecular chaperone GrpE (heat shock protein)